MNDKSLADKVVALGVNRRQTPDLCGAYDPQTWSDQSDQDFVRDFRVAGALIEKHPEGVTYTFDDDSANWVAWVYGKGHEGQFSNESLPRAIIEACCEALSE